MQTQPISWAMETLGMEQPWCNFQCLRGPHDAIVMLYSYRLTHPYIRTHTLIHSYLQRSLTEQVKRRSFNVMVPIALVNLSEVTATIKPPLTPPPFPLSVLCVCLKYYRSAKRDQIIRTRPQRWVGGPPPWFVPGARTHIHPDDAFIVDITLTRVSLRTSTISKHATPTSHLPTPHSSSPLFPWSVFATLERRGPFLSTVSLRSLGLWGEDHGPGTCWEKASHYTLALYKGPNWVGNTLRSTKARCTVGRRSKNNRRKGRGKVS